MQTMDNRELWTLMSDWTLKKQRLGSFKIGFFENGNLTTLQREARLKKQNEELDDIKSQLNRFIGSNFCFKGRVDDVTESHLTLRDCLNFIF